MSNQLYQYIWFWITLGAVLFNGQKVMLNTLLMCSTCHSKNCWRFFGFPVSYRSRQKIDLNLDQDLMIPVPRERSETSCVSCFGTSSSFQARHVPVSRGFMFRIEDITQRTSPAEWLPGSPRKVILRLGGSLWGPWPAEPSFMLTVSPPLERFLLCFWMFTPLKDCFWFWRAILHLCLGLRRCKT